MHKRISARKMPKKIFFPKKKSLDREKKEILKSPKKSGKDK